MNKKPEKLPQVWPKYVIPTAALLAVPLLTANKIYAEETDIPVPAVAHEESWESENLQTPVPDEFTASETENEEAALQTEQHVTYDYNAQLYDGADATDAQGAEYPGVYSTKVNVNNTDEASAPTIGMPSIADQNLDAPTTESPAIIQGAAVGYEEKIGPTEYSTLKERVAPYTEFKVSVVEEQAQDGSTHRKLTGFDGTYVILRVDVSEFYAQDPNKYLHVKQEKNMALIPSSGMVDNDKGFADMLGNKTGSYRLQDLIDQGQANVPYVDIVMFSTGKLAAGADAGKTDVANGDIPLHMYVDDIFDYNPDLKYDPQSTDPNHATQCLAKFYDATKAAAGSIANYLVKGSDLALETAVDDSGGENKDTGTTYWSLKKGFEDPYYDQEIDRSPEDSNCGRTLRLICEVPVVDGLVFQGESADSLRKRTLDVNSFDVQIANNTAPDQQTYTSGITLENAWLTIADKSNTTGAEMAIGNNAQFIIDQGGKLIIDETCQLEIEWDGATTTPSQDGQPAPAPDTLNNGILDLRPGGEIVNNGIITIEGTEGKPYQPDQGPAEGDKGFGEMIVDPGATFTNNGCLLVYGKFYNEGTLINNGRYEELITSNDPDKGLYSYHKGIQIAWKDDVTQSQVVPGTLYNGKGKDGTVYADALLQNNGDILLNPGEMENYGILVNGVNANIYLGTVDEAIIPVEPTQQDPTTVSKRIAIDPPKTSIFTNYGLLINDGYIVPCTVDLNDNGSWGDIHVPGKYPEMFTFINYGKVINRGYIYGWGSIYTNRGPVTGITQNIGLYFTMLTTALSGALLSLRKLRNKE